MLDVKLRKAQKKIVELSQQLQQAQMGVLNMRQMYEGVVGEKQSLQHQLQRANSLVLAAVVNARGKTLTIKEATFNKLGEFAGVDTKDDNGNLILTALTVADIEAMQEEIEQQMVEQEDE